MGMIKEFKEFAAKGNLVDIAVAFVMGAAFGKVVTALNQGIVMPLIGLLLGDFDLSEKSLVLKEGTAEVKNATGEVMQPAVEPVLLKWGAFVTACVDFLIIAFVMFLIVKAVNKMNRKKEEAVEPKAPEFSTTEKLLIEIRDQLKK